MNIDKYLDDMRSLQSEFLKFIDDDENFEEKFQNLLLLFEDKKIRENKNDLRLFLHHIASVCANHHRNKNFFSKIERVIKLFKDEIKKFYINSEIFSIFRKDKRILLFLVEEKILIFDEYVAKKITESKYAEKKYPQYFAPELKPFIKLPSKFYEMRKIGENERYISELIRNDNAKEFIAFVNQNNIPLKSPIKPSIYETNSFLIKKQYSDSDITMIEYAAFFGSIQIIKYLHTKGVEMNSSLWLYAIHSQNAHLIHFLEDCNVEPRAELCFMKSIKCNHIGIADYFLNNYLQNSDQKPNDTFIQSLKYYNFEFIQKEHVNQSSFCYLCSYDYYLFVGNLLATKYIDINIKTIQNHIFE
ncbi:hypothetical protein M9Y10_039420 [Tritrichomonas musculus]|uniref:DUF3447 domain-containing protein n=1 Tax=Tritrichomonas musculus TaxID=1915356 RepID=A0ABR2KB65_9EUKA